MAQVVIDFERLRLMECGLGQFCLEFGRALVNQTQDDVTLQFFLPERRADLFRSDSSEFPGNVSFQPVRSWKKSVFAKPMQMLTSPFVKGIRHDLWHMTNQLSRYSPWSPQTPMLLTIQDLNFLREKSVSKARGYLRAVQRRVDRSCAIAVISEFVRDEVQQHLRLDGKSVHVIHLGAGELEHRPQQQPDFAPHQPFLFSIGMIERKKNFHVLLDFLKAIPDYHLVLAGKNDSAYAAELMDRVVSEGLADRVVVPGMISDAERLWLYENCAAFVFPSLAEGFGLPPIEAMRFGKPVFLSTSTSLPEIGGNAAFYWETFDPQEMARVFESGMSSFARHPNSASQMKAQAARFTWQRTAAGYLALYDETISRVSPGALPEEKLAA